MSATFDDLIRTILGTGIEAYHEVKPSDFGEFPGRTLMFQQCLETMTRRSPTLRVTISGVREALLELGLEPGSLSVARHSYTVGLGPTFELGKVRLTFNRGS